MNTHKSIIASFILFIFLFLSAPILAQEKKKLSATDSLRFISWKINSRTLQFDTLQVDTLIDYFQLYNPVYKLGISQTYLGNLGLPAVTNSFIDRKYTTPFLFMQGYEPYMISPENTIYYNTHRPFTSLSYTSGGSSNTPEESVHIIHTQNINPNLNVAVNFNVFASVGMYPDQRSKDRIFSIHSNYVKKNYYLFASYNLNKFISQENGGLVADSSVNQSNQDFLPVRLAFAKSRTVSNTFYLHQSLTFGGRDTSDHSDSVKRKFAFPASQAYLTIRYDRSRRTFEETGLKSPSAFQNGIRDSAFFNHFYYSQDNSLDSVIFRKLSASLRYSLKENPLQKVPLGISFMAIQEILTYGYMNRPDTSHSLNAQSLIHNHFNFKAGMSISRTESERFKLVATGYLTLLGYEIGNYWLNGTLDMNFPLQSENKLHLGVTLRTDKPDFLLSNFESNYKKWDNNFNVVFRNEAEASYHMANEFEIKANVVNMNNFVYFNDSGYPDQTSKNLLVMSGSIDKTFRVWKYVSINKFIFQYSTNSLVLPLPTGSAYSSNFLDIQVVRHVLFAQLGFDIFYHTKYYGMAYDPVTGSFHTQQEKLIGNYPFVDGFLNLKLKRTRFYFKYEHADYGFLARDYFNSLHYPMNRGIFRFGLTWVFYD